MASTARKTFYSPEEYLSEERASDSRSEYRDGRIHAMSGASRPHNLIAANLARHLGNQLVGKGCELYIADMRVRIQATGSYNYPDLVICCGAPLLEDQGLDTLLNPTVIIEILSATTERYDRGVKFAESREIPSLIHYVLISQDQKLVERFTRDGDAWVLMAFGHPGDTLALPAIASAVRLADIYENVPLLSNEAIPDL